jgi:hypothetical protein
MTVSGKRYERPGLIRLPGMLAPGKLPEAGKRAAFVKGIPATEDKSQ